jgi:anhydro-N-acetylmuramic acid kinase
VASDGLFIGLMSGTSMDGIDAALLALHGRDAELLCTHTRAFSPSLRAHASEAASSARDDLHSLATLDRAIGLEFAIAANELIEKSGRTSADIIAIGSHGQTVRHHPTGAPEQRYSLQIGDPASIAEETGITTVADFRRRDIAAGGEGAPLVPLFHAARFSAPGKCRVIVNIGGISNATLLRGDTIVAGFDCGPGNTLLDAWTREHRAEDYDAFGAWAAEHETNPALLKRLTADPYFIRQGPRSTGPEHFSKAWLLSQLEGTETPGEVQATLAELTAFAIARGIGDCAEKPDAVFVCGGGARNTDLMRRLSRRLATSDIRLGTTDELGLAAEWVEACAFAWLARRTLTGLAGNAPVVTGSRGPRILGAIYPA